MTESNSNTNNLCAGYQRKPHTAQLVLFRQYPDGHKDGLCQICANRWHLSEEEWPPPKTNKTEAKTSFRTNVEVV